MSIDLHQVGHFWREREREREGKRERERGKERESFGRLYTGYPLSIAKIIHGLPIIYSKDNTWVTHYP